MVFVQFLKFLLWMTKEFVTVKQITVILDKIKRDPQDSLPIISAKALFIHLMYCYMVLVIEFKYYQRDAKDYYRTALVISIL